MNVPSRFAAVGVMNTLIDIAVFMVLQTFLPLIASTIIASMIAMVFSFALHSKYTFGGREFSWRNLGLFFLTTGIILWVLQPLVLLEAKAFLDLWFSSHALSVLAAKLVALAVSLSLNFVIYRYIIWPEVKKQ